MDMGCRMEVQEPSGIAGLTLMGCAKQGGGEGALAWVLDAWGAPSKGGGGEGALAGVLDAWTWDAAWRCRSQARGAKQGGGVKGARQQGSHREPLAWAWDAWTRDAWTRDAAWRCGSMHDTAW